MRNLFSLLMAFSMVMGDAYAQETFPVNGVRDVRHTHHAFEGATIYITPTQRMDSATMLVRDGVVVAVGKNITVPEGCVRHNCQGLTIYPSFIDAYAGIGAEKVKPVSAAKTKQEPAGPASHWNAAVHPHFRHQQAFPIEKKTAEDWLASGFGVANVHHRDGIMRGTSQVVLIGVSAPNEALLKDQATAHFSFSKGSSRDAYPSSHVGAIALIRQTLYDAQWYASPEAQEKERNPALEALQHISSQTCVFELNSPLSARNVQEIGGEFGLDFIVKTTGQEYLVMDELNADTRLIVPLNFPTAFDVKDPYEARMLSLAELRHWECAPFNPRVLYESGYTFSITRDTIRSAADFTAQLKKAIDKGLPHEAALAALTTVPAAYLGLGDKLGTLEPGKWACFSIANGPFSRADFAVYESWAHGERVMQRNIPDLGMVGKYSLVIDSHTIDIVIEEVTPKGIKAKAEEPAAAIRYLVDIQREQDLLTIALTQDDSTGSVVYRMSGKISFQGGVWDGQAQDQNGNWHAWAAVKDRKYKPAAKPAQKTPLVPQVPPLSQPNHFSVGDTGAGSRTFLITNAVVWTAADTGILPSADIYVVDGRIQQVGKNLLVPDEVRRIPAKGRHVTPGLVDEHSHIALRGGVNEWAQASSAEVRMADAIDPWNINIYRQLAGGVTTAQLLHGSANPIGGQSAIVKWKWGSSASGLLLPDAPAFIKFALGENVKRSPNRFPNTRMGVEQSIADGFVRAQTYMVRQQPTPAPAGRRLKRSEPTLTPVRRDLELDALAEILSDTRFITCHSYVQSEILMLMALGDSLGFHVNTFTHVLEGYKVGDALADHGASASTFSDWWAYKYEVKDAIPYNAAMLVRDSVNTGINSDDAEMGRRLNQEAAKTMKYGGLTQEEAIRLVTINPAKMLHLDHRIGSIEKGKDADLVIWSANPLSIYSHADKTFIEGVLYFDYQREAARQAWIQAERARIIALMLQSEEKKRPARPSARTREYHCDTILEDYLYE